MTSKERGLGFKILDIPKNLSKVGKVGVAAGLGIFLLSGIPEVWFWRLLAVERG